MTEYFNKNHLYCCTGQNETVYSTVTRKEL